MQNTSVLSAFEFNQSVYHYIDFNKLRDICPEFNHHQLPFSIKVLLESNLRRCESVASQEALLHQFISPNRTSSVNVFATRLLLQDYTGIPVLVDLCALRQVAVKAGLAPQVVNPAIAIDLVVDHSIVVDDFGRSQSKTINSNNQFLRNKERFTFLKWCAQAFEQTRIIPPDSGICHQVNLESLAQGFTLSQRDEKTLISPEVVIGTDSHTPTINSIGVLGWGVGGIEGLTTALGHPIELPMPEVVGVKLKGRMPPGIKATDCVLTLTSLLRKLGVVEKFVEFFGPGVATLTVTDRATIANMAPEYGATCAFFPWDERTVEFFSLTARANTPLFEAYAKASGLWRDETHERVVYGQVIEVDLASIQPVLAGPKKPDQLQILSDVPTSFLMERAKDSKRNASLFPDGAIALAAITSCTNTANPDLMVTAALLARNATRLGLKVPSWVKTLFAPGSLTVSEYLNESGLQKYLDDLGFHVDGFGCTACIGNSGALVGEVEDAIKFDGLTAVSVLSGNRNFSGRVQQLLSFNYLASPPLVVAFALAGKIGIDLSKDPLSEQSGKAVYLRDLWPNDEEVQEVISKFLHPRLFAQQQQLMHLGSKPWADLAVSSSLIYDWGDQSGFVAQPPFFDQGPHSKAPSPLIEHARVLLLLGDGVTTDDISPAGNIQPNTLAGDYLSQLGLSPTQLHTFGARRGNWQAMLNGAFTNKNLINQLAPEHRGGMTLNHLNQKIEPILHTALDYQAKEIDSIILAGKNYGVGSSRDDAARSTRLLGVRIVIAQSFERIHRSNLCAFSVLPLLFLEGQSSETYQLDGSETFSFDFTKGFPLQGSQLHAKVKRKSNEEFLIPLQSALRSEEMAYFLAGGVLPKLSKNIIEGQ
jgi:aconitate hydratase